MDMDKFSGGLLSLKWSEHREIITSIIKCEIELLINSQTVTNLLEKQWDLGVAGFAFFARIAIRHMHMLLQTFRTEFTFYHDFFLFPK